MRVRYLAPAAAVVSAVGSLLSAFLLPWAWYGDIDVPLHRLPGWGVYAAALPLFLAVVAWVLFTPGRTRRRVLLVVAMAATVTAAIVVAAGYDNASALFSGTVPAVRPRPGPGPLLAIAAALVGLCAVVKPTRTTTPAGG